MLSPVLYATFMDGIIARLDGCCGVRVGGVEIRALLYADDIVLLSDSASDLRRMPGEVQRFADDRLSSLV